MARGNNDREQGTEKGKIRVFFAEVEGSNQTLQDVLRTVSHMLPRPVEVKVPPKLVQNGAAGAAPNARPAEPDLFNQDAVAPEVIDAIEMEQPEAGDSNAPRRKRGVGANRDRNAGLAIVKALNLHPDGKESLKDFVAKKKPKTQEEHIAVYIYYLKNVIGEPNVGFSHIFTCFKETGERMPGDLPQTCRNAASKKGWLDTSDANDLKRTTRGDNLVEKDLPRAGGAGGDEGK
jgi:hypothetical protein